jgi:cytochrome c oxidase assembly protein subunit 15
VLLMGVASLALPAGHRRLKAFSLAAAALVAVQIALGVLTLRLQLQMPAVTVAHQLAAALLVAVIGALGGLTLISLFPSSRPVPVHG